MRKSGHFQVWTLFAVLAALASQAHAEEISFKATGTVTSVTGFKGGNVAIGETITFCYTFESTTPDADPTSLIGNYRAGLNAVTVEAGSLTLTNPASGGDILEVTNRRVGSPDRYDITKSGLSGSGFTGVVVDLFLRDPTGRAFSSEALPLIPFDVSAFATRRLTLAGGGGSLVATVDSLELCVEPDTTPPVVSCAIAKSSLWPPNHQFVDVGLSFDVEDDQDPNPTVEIFVFSNEPEEDDTGDGNTDPDADIGPDYLDLRAERKGDGNGRVYLVVVAATDESGNTGYHCCTVTVPHDQSKKSKDAVATEALGIEMACELLDAASVEDLLTGLDALGLHQLGN